MPDYEPITPTGAVVAGFRWMWVAIIAFVVALVAVTVLWQIGWIFSNANVNRQTQQIQNSDSNQRALVADLTSQIANTESITSQMAAASGQQLADLHAQRLGVARIACGDAAQLSGSDVLGDGVPQWIKSNCLAGTVSPGSSLEK
jgi:uncharacterized protein YlxW (UPF0749 family)